MDYSILHKDKLRKNLRILIPVRLNILLFYFHSHPMVVPFPALSILSLNTTTRLLTMPSLPLGFAWKNAAPLSLVVPSAPVRPIE
jgi:hypothetical protein